MKKSDLTAYLDDELDPAGIAEVEEAVIERQELLNEISDLSNLRFLLAEYFSEHKQEVATPIPPRAKAAPSVRKKKEARQTLPPEPVDVVETAEPPQAPEEESAFPTEPPPVEVERPRRARSGPAPFVIAAAASLTALLVLNSLEIGGWTRSSRALADSGFVMRYGQTKAIDKPRVLYFDDYLTTQDDPVPVTYSDTSTSITLGPWSKARFTADLNSKCIELVEGTLKVKIEPLPPPKKPPPPPPKKKPKEKPKSAPKLPPAPPKVGWKQIIIDTIEPWLTPRKVVNEYQLLITSTAGTLDIPQKHTDVIEFDLSVIDQTFELNHRRGATNLSPTGGGDRRVGGRQQLRSIGDGKVHRIGKVKSKARIELSDAKTKAILPTCASVRPNEHVGLSFRNARPITAEFKMGKQVTSVHFFLSHKAPGSDKFTDLNADSFRPKGKVTTSKAPYLFFGEHNNNPKNPSSWTPHKPGIYRLRAVPVLPKQSKPNWKEAVVIYLQYD